jgi:hypothetical protein
MEAGVPRVEMGSFDQGVGGGRADMSRRKSEGGGVVADSQQDIPSAASPTPLDAFYQAELTKLSQTCSHLLASPVPSNQEGTL